MNYSLRGEMLLPQAGPYGASEPRVSPTPPSRDVLAPHLSPAQSDTVRVQRDRDKPATCPKEEPQISPAAGSIVGPPKPPNALGRRRLPAGGREGGGSAALLPGAMAASAPPPWLWVALTLPAAPGAFPAERPRFVMAVSACPPVHPACPLPFLVGTRALGVPNTPENPHQREWVGAPPHAGAVPGSWGCPGLCWRAACSAAPLERRFL